MAQQCIAPLQPSHSTAPSHWAAVEKPGITGIPISLNLPHSTGLGLDPESEQDPVPGGN